ncbi:MAG: tetratricopeptide repeat protein [Candidatus Omnitrophota bacterium]|nr:tetratricopeptide repeat protein [Candidatus Omnitrophota bacterium]
MALLCFCGVTLGVSATVHAQEERAVAPRSSPLTGELHEENTTLYQVLETSLQEITTLRQRNLNLLQLVSEAKQGRQNLQDQVVSLTKANAALEAKAKELMQAQQEREQLAQQLAALKRKAQVDEAQLTALQKTQSAFESKVTTLTDANTDLLRHVHNLTRVYEDNQRLETELFTLRKALQEEQAKLASHRTEVETLTQARAALEAKAKELTQLQQDHARLEQGFAALRTQSTADEAKLGNLQKTNRALEGHVTTLTETTTKLRRQVAELLGLYDDKRHLEAELAALRKALQEEQAKGGAGQRDLHTLTKDNAHLKETVQELNGRVHELTREKERLALEGATTPSSTPRAPQGSVDRERAALYQELGAAYAKAQLFGQAIDAYQRCLDADPDNAQAHYSLGLLYQHAQNNRPLSISHLQQYLALSPNLSAKQRREVEYLIRMLTDAQQAKR